MAWARIWWSMYRATAPALHRPARAFSIVQGDLVKYHTTHCNAAAAKPKAAGHRQACVATHIRSTQSLNFRKTPNPPNRPVGLGNAGRIRPSLPYGWSAPRFREALFRNTRLPAATVWAASPSGPSPPRCLRPGCTGNGLRGRVSGIPGALPQPDRRRGRR